MIFLIIKCYLLNIEKIDNLNVKINYNNAIVMYINNKVVINEILSMPIDKLTLL